MTDTDSTLFDIFMNGTIADVSTENKDVRDESKIEIEPAPILPAALDFEEPLPPSDEKPLEETETVVKKSRKSRGPKKERATAAKVLKVKKTHHDKTDKNKTAESGTGRHCPGYSMLRVERDKIERSRLTLLRKNEIRTAQGKPAPTVCSILNDRLVEFYNDIAGQFDERFGKYLKKN